MLFDPDFKYTPELDSDGYKNPLDKNRITPDPRIIYNERDGYYYGIYTGQTHLTLHRTRDIRCMFNSSEESVIYLPSDADGTYGFLWAPEIHIIDGVWYIYTSTHERDTKNFKHVIVLRAKDSENPMAGFELAAHVNPTLYAIDPTILDDPELGLYICYSAVLEGCQRLCIQKMKSPTEPEGDYAVIASPVYPWELIPPYDMATEPINEGAFFIKKGKRLFIVYSGNGCWSNDYVFGIIEFKGGDLLDPTAWEKLDTPFMTRGNGNFGPGHATFFTPPTRPSSLCATTASITKTPSAWRYPATVIYKRCSLTSMTFRTSDCRCPRASATSCPPARRLLA